jgi:hypothetical protein
MVFFEGRTLSGTCLKRQLLAHSVSYCVAKPCPELGGKADLPVERPDFSV